LPPLSPEQHQVQVGSFIDLVQIAVKQIEAEVIEPGADNNKLPPTPDSSDIEESNQTATGDTGKKP
jgi:hypothetical protein